MIEKESERRYQTTSMSNQIHRENMNADRQIFTEGCEFALTLMEKEAVDDAVGFFEWCKRKRIISHDISDDDSFTHWFPDGLPRTYTTTELYEKFKQQS